MGSKREPQCRKSNGRFVILSTASAGAASVPYGLLIHTDTSGPCGKSGEDVQAL